MAYRITGFALIAFIAVYIAFSIIKYGKDKIRFHSCAVDFIIYVRQQIEFFCTPTSRIIEGYNDEFLRDCGFFDDKGIEANPYLDRRGKKLLLDFFSRLGKSNTEDQIANCDYAVEGLNALLAEYRQDISKKYKAYSALALISGLMLLVLLI